MKICPKCGYSNEELAAVCSGCGSSLNDGAEMTGQFNTNESNDLPVQARTNGFAIASLVLGISSLPLVCCCYIGVLTGILAVVFGFLAKNKINSSNGLQKGNGMALAGIILGFAGIGFTIILLIIAMVAPDLYSNDLNKWLNQLENMENGY